MKTNTMNVHVCVIYNIWINSNVFMLLVYMYMHICIYVYMSILRTGTCSKYFFTGKGLSVQKGLETMALEQWFSYFCMHQV